MKPAGGRPLSSYLNLRALLVQPLRRQPGFELPNIDPPVRSFLWCRALSSPLCLFLDLIEDRQLRVRFEFHRFSHYVRVSLKEHLVANLIAQEPT